MVTKMGAPHPPVHGSKNMYRTSGTNLLRGKHEGEGEGEEGKGKGKGEREGEGEKEDRQREDEDGAFIECAVNPYRPRASLLGATSQHAWS